MFVTVLALSPCFRRFAKGSAYAEQVVYHPATGRASSCLVLALHGLKLTLESLHVVTSNPFMIKYGARKEEKEKQTRGKQ